MISSVQVWQLSALLKMCPAVLENFLEDPPSSWSYKKGSDTFYTCPQL